MSVLKETSNLEAQVGKQDARIDMEAGDAGSEERKKENKA